MEPYVDKETGKLVKQVSREDTTKTKGKFKLYKVVSTLIIVGGITMIAKCSIEKKIDNYKLELNNRKLKDNNYFEQTISEGTVGQVLTDKEIEEYQKYIGLLNVKRWYDAIDLSKYDSYDINYDDITLEHAEELSNTYYSNIINGEEHLTDVCVEMKSIKESVEKFEKEQGQDLIKNTVTFVLLSKAIESNNLNINNVQRVALIQKGNSLRVEFDYLDNGKITKYISDKFEDQGYDLVEDLGKDIKNNDAIAVNDTLGGLVSDENYEVGIKVK